MEKVLATVQELVATFGLKIIAAIAIFIIGRWVAKSLTAFARSVIARKIVDPMLVGFGANFTYIALLTFVILASIGQLGVQTTSFIAVIGASGLAIGFALQGSLTNFAAGVLLMIFRPFQVGDYVDAGGVAGLIEEVQIFTTTLKTPDNRTIIVPNGKIMGDNITNYTANETRRIDLSYGVGYESDINQVKAVINGILENDSRILKEPTPPVRLMEMGDSSLNFVVRP
jgi:small conductance mechanosensitive channel